MYDRREVRLSMVSSVKHTYAFCMLGFEAIVAVTLYLTLNLLGVVPSVAPLQTLAPLHEVVASSLISVMQSIPD